MENDHFEANLFSLTILKMTNLNKKENRENFSTIPKWGIGLIVAAVVIFVIFVVYNLSSGTGNHNIIRNHRRIRPR